MGNGKKLSGIGVSPGVAAGKLYIYEAYTPKVEPKRASDTVRELERFEEVRKKAKEELLEIIETLTPEEDDKSAILAAHIDIVMDEEIGAQICESICGEGYSAEFAVRDTFQKFEDMFSQMDDPVIRSRAVDMTDVSLRLLRILEGKEERRLSKLAEPVIVAAYDLLPSDTAALDQSNVLGILSETGSVTSHTAIIAKNNGIPAILSVSGLMSSVRDGQMAAMDPEKGIVVLDPDEVFLRSYESKRLFQERERRKDQSCEGKELYTKDGVRIFVNANIGSPSSELELDAKNVDGVGLFRTEFLYMKTSHPPTEEEQFKAYSTVLRAYKDKPVILRTIDIGGDKSLPYMSLPKEDNPFLGVRALRLCYKYPELLHTQLRAALRASALGTLKIMFPMVGSIEEVRWAKEMVRKAGRELDLEGVPWDHSISLGIMMEVPSIMMIADLVAREVDFASVGTNDLCQYLTAADRLNAETTRYYQNFHPAMFRLIGYAAREFSKQGKALSVCGEIAGDPMAAPVLLGLGVRKLSMSRISVGRMKRKLSDFRMEKMEELAREILMCSTEADVREKLCRMYSE